MTYLNVYTYIVQFSLFIICIWVTKLESKGEIQDSRLELYVKLNMRYSLTGKVEKFALYNTLCEGRGWEIQNCHMDTGIWYNNQALAMSILRFKNNL